MKRKSTIFHPLFIFIISQLAWLSLLGLWIYWFVSNYIIFNQVGNRLAPQMVPKATNIFALVLGVCLLLFLLLGMYLIFSFLNRQRQITQLYDNFIANITHELKSPLASIQLYLETLNTREVPLQRRQEFLNLMLQDANRLQNLINNILQISGLQKKINVYHFSIYNADALISQIIKETEQKFKLSAGKVRITGAANKSIVADVNALKMVFDNLVDNALKYSMNEHPITVHLAAHVQNVVVEIIDRGIGIELNDQKKIFQKFQRVYYSYSPNVKGTGLGLYLAKEIVKYHGGKISVYSRGKNTGTTFRVEFPVYHAKKKGYIQYLLKLTQKNKEAESEEFEDE
ncbi:HAMP domain-containing histidine kinase [candidate division KSB1 bacterium]|nr:HAMP domain-containing histidine kinase [candidate division KSB1 bacterium]